MELNVNGYVVLFRDGGLSVQKDGRELYFNRRPVYVSVKTYGALNEFRDIPYEDVRAEDGAVCAQARFETDNGSVLLVRDPLRRGRRGAEDRAAHRGGARGGG